MALALGSHLGPYEIIAPVGSGGMARCIGRTTLDSDGMSPSKCCPPSRAAMPTGCRASSRKPALPPRSIIVRPELKQGDVADRFNAGVRDHDSHES
jgi:hypothetical protein